MPRKRQPCCLKLTSIQNIGRNIDWFADRYERFDLAPNLLILILDQLKRWNKLDKRHLQLVISENLTELDLSNSCHNGSQVFVALDLIDQRRPNLTHLDLSNVLQLPDIFIDAILPRLNNLQILNLRSTSCGDRELHAVANNCLFLKHLDVSLNDRVTNTSIEFLCQVRCKHLEWLDLMHTRVDDTGIRQLLHHLPHLLILRWRNTINVAARMCHEQSPDSPRLALRRLMADQSYLPLNLRGAVYVCLNAVQVIIDGACQLQSDDLKQLECLQSLVKLYVVLGRGPRGYLHFEEGGMRSLLERHGPTLRHLTLGLFEQVDVEHISKQCRHLSSLILDRNQSFRWSDERPVPSISSLEKFELVVRDPIAQVNDELRDVPPWHLGSILSSPLLKQVKITACHTLDDAVFISNGISAQLETLELQSCPRITAVGLWNALDRSDSLTCLNIYRCESISDLNVADIRASIDSHQWDLQVDYYRDDDT